MSDAYAGASEFDSGVDLDAEHVLDRGLTRPQILAGQRPAEWFGPVARYGRDEMHGQRQQAGRAADTQQSGADGRPAQIAEHHERGRLTRRRRRLTGGRGRGSAVREQQDHRDCQKQHDDQPADPDEDQPAISAAATPLAPVAPATVRTHLDVPSCRPVGRTTGRLSAAHPSR